MQDIARHPISKWEIILKPSIFVKVLHTVLTQRYSFFFFPSLCGSLSIRWQQLNTEFTDSWHVRFYALGSFLLADETLVTRKSL